MEQKEDKKKESECFYHYTTQDTLCCMLNKYREDKDQGNLIFFASSIFTMNDPQEMKHGVDVFKVLIPFNENFYDILPEERLNIDSFDSDKILMDHKHTPFVISFSANRDDLAMWALYGDGGRGIVLKFSKDLESYSSAIDAKKPENVYYGKGTDRIQSIFQIYNEGLIKQRGCKNEDEKTKYRETTLSKLYACICPFIKTESYRNENESRLSYCDVPSNLVKFRIRNKTVIPYIEVPIPIKYLEEVIVGPCCSELAKNSIRFLLDSCGLQRVDISESKIPYRSI